MGQLGKILVFLVQLGLFSNRMVRKHYFKAYFVKKKAKRKNSNFSPKSSVNPFKKISIRQLGKILIFLVQLGLLSNPMGSKHYFKAYLLKKQAKRKIPIFDQIHGLTPLKKSPQGDLVKSLSFQFSQACFLTGSSANIISRRILLKSKKRGKFQFFTKLMG